MSVTTSWTKDPDATLDYEVDWTSWLATADTIVSSQWIIPSGITKDSDTSTTTSATVWLSGGTAGTAYEVTNRIVTNEGRTDDRTIHIIVRDR